MLKRLRSKLNNKGFTLIELIVVIAIIGILMTLAVPRLIGYQEAARETADEQLRALYGNTFTVLIAQGKIKNTSTSNDAIVIINADGSFGTLPTTLEAFNPTTETWSTIGAAPASGSGDPAGAAPTLAGIQHDYVAVGGKGSDAVPTFKSKLYTETGVTGGGIKVIISTNNTVTTAINAPSGS